MPTNAAIYCRLSYAPDGSPEKVERQEADSRDIAHRLGWTVTSAQLQHGAPPGVLQDNSRSAWQRTRQRPGWDRLLAAIAAREVDAVIVYHGDRLIRQPYDLEMLLQLTDQYALPLASVSGVRDLSSADDRFVLRIEVAQACRESDNISRRVTRGWAARASKGLPAGGPVPFGFRDATTVDDHEAAITAEAAERLLSGQSKSGVVAWLNEVSTTSTGRPWTPRGLRQMLLAPRIAGLVANNGTMHTAVWDPIISVETWEEVKALYATSAKTYPYPGRKRKYLLSGIAECHACGGTLATKPTGGRNRKSSRIYHCKQCRTMGRSVANLDAYVAGRVLRVLSDPAFVDELNAASDSGDSGIGKQIAELERRRDASRQQLAALADHPELDPRLIAESLASFDRRIGELRARQSTDMRHRLLSRVAGIDHAGWEQLPMDVRAEVVRNLFRVTVLRATWRGPGFEPRSVRLERRPVCDQADQAEARTQQQEASSGTPA